MVVFFFCYLLISFLLVGPRGGGVINITATNTLAIYGSVRADGGSSSSGGSGGGSGGSIFIKASEFRGSGDISTNGGAASATSERTGGAGGGGRVAVYYGTYSFSGKITSTGGKGVTRFHGAPGTVYFQDTTTGYKKLAVGNANLTIVNTVSPIAWLMGTESVFEFDEIYIDGNGALAIRNESRALVSI